MSGYSTREVAELVGLKPAQVRDYVRNGLLPARRGPRGEFRFDFQDMVLLRTAKGLREARVPPRRALAALRDLRRELGDDRALASLRIQADGGRVVVRDDTAMWDARTGQGHLDFFTGALAGEVAELRQRRFAAELEGPDTDDFFNLGIDLEDVDPDRAVDAYLRALELDPDNVDAHVNLGRLLQTGGYVDEARQHYRSALERAPEHQLALFNLGTTFDERDEFEPAVEYYRRAGDVADAHYNLCRIFEIRGDELAALRHLRRYRALMAAGDSD